MATLPKYFSVTRPSTVVESIMNGTYPQGTWFVRVDTQDELTALEEVTTREQQGKLDSYLLQDAPPGCTMLSVANIPQPTRTVSEFLEIQRAIGKLPTPKSSGFPATFL
mgnify:CR=1 FL=1